MQQTNKIQWEQPLHHWRCNTAVKDFLKRHWLINWFINTSSQNICASNLERVFCVNLTCELSVSLWNSPNVQGCVLRKQAWRRFFSASVTKECVFFVSDVISHVRAGYWCVEVSTNWENKFKEVKSVLWNASMRFASTSFFCCLCIQGHKIFRKRQAVHNFPLICLRAFIAVKKYLKFVALSIQLVPVVVPLTGGFCKWTQRNQTYANQPTV